MGQIPQMKITIYQAPDGWRWALTASNGRTIAIGEAYERPQKLVQSLNKYIVRGDTLLQLTLNASLNAYGLAPDGSKQKVLKDNDGELVWTEKK